MPRSTRPPRSLRDTARFLTSFLIGIILLSLVIIGPTRDARVAGWLLLMLGCLYPIFRTVAIRDIYVISCIVLSFTVVGIIALHESQMIRALLAAAIVFVSAIQNRLRSWREIQALRQEAEKTVLAELEQGIRSNHHAPGGP